MLFLEKQGVGLRVQAQRIPTVPTAAIFDLGFGDASVRPNRAMGLQACQNAHPGPVTAGSVGAGTGATVGKLFGPEQSMKGGVGSASTEAGGLIVGALVVANPYGDITDHTGRILAGARRAPQSLELADSARMLAEGRALSRGLGPENTTLAVIAVNAALSKPVASGVAAQATLGLSHVIRPFHSHIDGDLTIVLSAGERLVDPNQVGLMAADTLRRAVGKAIRAADGFGIVPAHRDVCA
jgi:L-aminopeptidase/D-esterase-like protein